MAGRPEEKLHFAVANFLKFQHPNSFFISESSGIRCSPGMAKKLKATRSNHTHVDLYLFEPRKTKNNSLGVYCGLFIELKAVNIYKKDGSLLSNEHVEDQARTIEKLNKKGYYATFAVGLDQTLEIIESYLNGDY